MVETLERAAEEAAAGELLLARARCEGWHAGATPDSENPSDFYKNTANYAAVEASLGNLARAQQLWELIPISHRTAAVRRNLQVIQGGNEPDVSGTDRPQRIAILSLLFNWPSTGGGTVHTKELAANFSSRGYEVLQIYTVYQPWGIGRVSEPLNYPSQSLPFSSCEWNEQTIRERYRQALREFQPDWVIVTDSWSSKPLLVEAAEGYRTLIRIAAQESICPLNNVRLLVNGYGTVQQCDRCQLADPEECQRCVGKSGATLSGPLHQAERELCGFGTAEYADRLRRAFAQVEGVLVVNPSIAELVRPHTKSVSVIPSGFDPQRFAVEVPPPPSAGRKLRILFAGLMQEFMKGFHVLREAGRQLWSRRQDFEVWATGEVDGLSEPWLKCLGWQSQEELPDRIRECDLLVFPTVAQEALGRTAVEAMACGRPVVASRIGGLQWVVEENITGLLAVPGDPQDLAAKIEQLLDDAPRREQLGIAGREKFLREFTWNAVYERHYRPLLGVPVLPTCLSGCP